MNFLRTIPNLITIPTLLVLPVLLQACGGQAYYTTLPDTTVQVPSPPVSYLPTPTVTAVPGSSGSTSNLPPPIQYTFTLTGSSGSFNSGTNTSPSTYTTSNITTDNILKVEVGSGSPLAISGASGWTANYSCLRFTVAVGGQSQQTTVSFGNPPTTNSATGGTFPCYDSSTSANYPTRQTLDFSSVATPGHGPLQVTVSQAYYDNCRNTTYPYYMYGYWYAWGISSSNQQGLFISGDGPKYAGCNMSPVYSTHSVQGTLKIHTNSTL